MEEKERKSNGSGAVVNFYAFNLFSYTRERNILFMCHINKAQTNWMRQQSKLIQISSSKNKTEYSISC